MSDRYNPNCYQNTADDYDSDEDYDSYYGQHSASGYSSNYDPNAAYFGSSMPGPTETHVCSAFSSEDRPASFDQNMAEGKHAVVDIHPISRGNGRDDSRAGYGLYWGQDHPNNCSQQLPAGTTNNQAAIEAAAEAIQQAKDDGYRSLDIHTDNKYLVDAATKNIPTWQENGWMKSNGEQAKNVDALQHLDKLHQGFDVSYNHDRHGTTHGSRGSYNAARNASRP